MRNVPLRYKDASMNDVSKDIQEKIATMKETRRGIYIHGPVGTGKTHVAYAIAKEIFKTVQKDEEGDVLAEGVSLGTFVNASELFAEMRRDMDKDFANKTEPLQALMETRRVIIIDDIGAEKPSEWVSEQFYLLLNHRYNEVLPVIFTSNLSPAQLEERLGDRTVSRIVGMCDIVKLSGVDRRIPKS